MPNAQFITIQSLATTGTLGNLPRIPVLVTREAVAGYTPDAETGLIKINSSDLVGFETANATSYGLRNSLRITFGQNYSYPFVYILSVVAGITVADLDKANIRPRDWSFLVHVDRYQGAGTGFVLADNTAYFEDLAVIKTWGPRTHRKICFFNYSVEESAGIISLPAELILGGVLSDDDGFKCIVSNSTSLVDAETVYDNIALAWISFVINGTAVSRSWGSLSDAHDFLLIGADTYSVASRSLIENNSLGQYNGAKDRAGSLFVYDTQMNDSVNPPLTDQVESMVAGDYIEDYVYVFVHNALQSAGQTGVPNDDSGIRQVAGLVRQALNDCFDLNLILGKENGSPDYSAGCLTAAQVSKLSANWQTTGIWPAGVIFAKIRRFGAGHYVTISFTF